MDLTTLYAQKKSAYAPAANEPTYEQFVYKMESSGVNDLVARNVVDPTFRPPTVNPSYLATSSKIGIGINRTYNTF